MNILQIAILVFAVIELGNVLMLYFKPGTRLANGVGVFNAYERSKLDPTVHDFVKYLIWWVAGAKLIFILIAVVVIAWGSELVQILTVGALILSILSFFWRLLPMIRKMDKQGEITPKGYSKTLAAMICVFVLGFTAVLIIALV